MVCIWGKRGKVMLRVFLSLFIAAHAIEVSATLCMLDILPMPLLYQTPGLFGVWGLGFRVYRVEGY